jgi:hypothetical protein
VYGLIHSIDGVVRYALLARCRIFVVLRCFSSAYPDRPARRRSTEPTIPVFAFAFEPCFGLDSDAPHAS